MKVNLQRMQTKQKESTQISNTKFKDLYEEMLQSCWFVDVVTSLKMFFIVALAEGGFEKVTKQSLVIMSVGRVVREKIKDLIEFVLTLHEGWRVAQGWDQIEELLT